MALSIYNIRTWFKMLTGTSVHHVNQTMGKYFEKNILKGYFNNLTEKVTLDPDNSLDNRVLPIDHEPCGDVYFPVGIFQYALGAYDLFIETGEERYLAQFKLCAEWTVEHQENTGAWNNFFFRHPEYPYGAMCQGEAASVLTRAYQAFNDDKFLESAKKAIEFMLLSVEEGGTTQYDNDEIILLEYTHLSPVLNGWIFAAFGLYDLYLATGDVSYKVKFNNTVSAIKKRLRLFDNGFWSMYDLGGKITSPFYHRLHVAQMEALYVVTGELLFDEYCKRWKKYESNIINKSRAFVVKAVQKIKEK